MNRIQQALWVSVSLCSIVLRAAAVEGQTNNVVIDGVLTDWADETTISDPDGCDDIMGQRDLQLAGIASNFDTVMPADTICLLQVFDETGTSGANTMDGCWLLDNDSNGMADLAMCTSTEMNPAVMIAGWPQLLTCNDSNNDRCGGAATIASPTLSCAVVQNEATLDCSPNGTAIECCINVSDLPMVAAGDVVSLLAGCTFPSGQANSAPADCAFSSPGETIDTTTGNNTPVELISFSVE